MEDSNFYLLNDQMMYAYVERKGFAIALYQPVASFLVHGKRKYCFSLEYPSFFTRINFFDLI